ncbi:hypothetical protein K32_20420 [Kaistia sp. 32K]|uniref:helix-turn-helix domain-containing protein n=1 Tax=Kaistia sp. 32K TaxID=2795690 RepID=UPI0019150D22|nr:helix-turn-helix transcriptional regulator [Kaistia sp. 32K]BCP53425.1 hypothetical protein K32_20420 [Kaistia sp. 32K]
MVNRLKHFRVAAGLTQSEVAKAINVAQPTYQRWEAGSVPVPPAKLANLAKTLQTSKEALLGRHPPIEAAFYDDSAPRELQYYGEVAVHFIGGGESLLLSISEEARSRLFQSLRSASKFLTIRDLGNRTVAIRRESISDLYLSSDAYDDCGPEHYEPGYKDGTPVQSPDTRDWEIIECLACDDEEGLEDFSSEHVKRVQKMVLITDEQYEELVAKGHIKAEDLETEKAKNALLTESIFELATSVGYQLSTGQQRRVNVIGSELYEAFGDLVDDGDTFDEDSPIVLQSEGYDRAVCINADALDYISIPTHLLERSRDDVSAVLLDELSGDD